MMDANLINTGAQLKAWREARGLTQQQLAERMRVTRATIQNWEGSPNIAAVTNMAASVLDARLKQEDPLRGPVTLIYADGPMFVDPYGPRRRPAMIQQEPYPSNAMALARVEALWADDRFHNPFVLEIDGMPLWNAVELARVANGADTTAPTVLNLLRKTAQTVRDSAHIFARSGARLMTPDETTHRQAEIRAKADVLDEIAAAGLRAAVDRDSDIEAVFEQLRGLGAQAPDDLVSAISHGLEVLGRSWGPRIDGPNYVLDHKGFQITWLRVPMTTAEVLFDISAETPSRFGKIDRRRSSIRASDAKSGLQEAKAYIDSIA